MLEKGMILMPFSLQSEIVRSISKMQIFFQSCKETSKLHSTKLYHLYDTDEIEPEALQNIKDSPKLDKFFRCNSYFSSTT